MQRLLLVPALVTWVTGCGLATGPASVPISPAEPGAVGMVTRDYVDGTRQNWDATGPRPLRTAIWYPAPSQSEMTESVAAGFFQGGMVAPDAPVSPVAGGYPLIVLSHGTGGTAVQMMWLGRFLASRGYVVAAVNHHGNTGAEPLRRAQGFLLYWERASDLSRVLDKVLSDPKFVQSIDRTRIGAAGFSLGGYTVLLTGGARFSARQFDAFCASDERDFTCEPQPEHPTAHEEFAALRRIDRLVIASLRRSDESYRDERIRAVFAIAPALGSGLTPESLRQLPVPLHVVVGADDPVTPAASNASRVAALVPRASLTILPRVTHYTFLNPCNERGLAVLDLCRDPDGTERRAMHLQVGKLADRFFRETLR